MAEIRDAIEKLNATLKNDPQNGALYFNRGLQLSQVRNRKAAIEDFTRAIELNVNPTTAAYNIACMHSLDGNKKEALSWLRHALDEGFDSWNHIENDSDLNNLRKSAEFQKLVAEYRSGE